MGWRGKQRSDDEWWLRGLDFSLGPVKNHRQGMNYPDCALERSLGSWLRPGIHFQNIRTPLVATS